MTESQTELHITTNEELIFAETIARKLWNDNADEFNQWDTLGQDEKDEICARINILLIFNPLNGANHEHE